MVKKLLQLVSGQFALWTSGRKRDRNVWIFSSTNNTEFNYNSKYLFLYVKENFPKVQPRFVINDEHKRRRLAERYGEDYFIETKSFSGKRNVLKAGVWFTSAGLPVYALGCGRHRTIINLWHGVPLKKIALLEEHVSKLSKLYFHRVFSMNYTYILTTAQELIPVMAESFGVNTDKIKVWGQPRNDAILAGADGNKRLEEICGNLPDYKRAILYAPTYREDGRVRLFPFEDMDMDAFAAWLKQENLLLCMRAHIEETDICKSYAGERIVDVSANVVDDISDYLGCFDVLITDYSSIYIDYLLLNRPMLFLPYDKEEYLQRRGMNFVYDEVTPGAKPQNYQEFVEALEDALYKDSYKEERIRVNRRFNEVQEPCCGNICENVAHTL